MAGLLARQLPHKRLTHLISDDNSIRWAKNKGIWFKTGYSSTSKEITVDLPKRHYCFDPTKSYHLWYAEDEHDYFEGDNHGTAKTDVFVKLACPPGFFNPAGKDGCKPTRAGGCSCVTDSVACQR